MYLYMIAAICINLIGAYFVIALHELAHYLVALLTGIRIDKIYIGFNPAFIEKHIGSTTLSIGVLVLGGAILPHKEFESKHWLKRFLLFLAGPVASITAPILFLLSSAGSERISVLVKMLPDIFSWSIIAPNSWIDGAQNEKLAIWHFLDEIFATYPSVPEYILMPFVMIALLSLSLGVLSLIPVPFFDGGRIIFTLLEGIFGVKVQRIANPLYKISAVIIVLIHLVYAGWWVSAYFS